MFTVDFYASCFISKGTSIGKKLIRLGWEKAIYQQLFMLANMLNIEGVLPKKWAGLDSLQI